MKTKELPTVDELNAIQAEWMALNPDAPEKEKQRVFALMRRYPNAYISGHDGRGVVVLDGGPINQAMDFQFCIDLCLKLGGRIDIAWNGRIGQWYSL